MISSATSEKKISKKQQGTYPANLQNYFDEAVDTDLSTAFEMQKDEAEKLFSSIDEDRSMTKYAEGKWTLKEVLQHIIDAERIFAYRALAIARKDNNTLPSFDENEYGKNADGGRKTWKDLVDEFSVVRKSAEFLYKGFSDEALGEVGNVSSYSIGVTTLGFVIVGHVSHHLGIIRERYLK